MHEKINKLGGKKNQVEVPFVDKGGGHDQSGNPELRRSCESAVSYARIHVVLRTLSIGQHILFRVLEVFH